MKAKISAAMLFCCLAASLIAMVRANPDLWGIRWPSGFEILVALTFPLLLFGCIRAFFNLRFAYGLGLAAGLLALTALARVELLFINGGASVWLSLNLPDREVLTRVAPWIILATVAALFTLLFCAMRLLPDRWTWRGEPLQRRTWPAVIATLVIGFTWYALSVSPYRLPFIVDFGTLPEYWILHVEKEGLHFRETVVSVNRDGRFAVTRTERRLFQYRFPSTSSMGTLPADARSWALAYAKSDELRNLKGDVPEPLRRWKDEGWYVRTPQSRPVGFTKSTGTFPPQRIVDTFHRLEVLPSNPGRTTDEKDVCLGFCYDSAAALGIVFLNQRCRSDDHGRWHCR